jgi:hypothetical protein
LPSRGRLPSGENNKSLLSSSDVLMIIQPVKILFMQNNGESTENVPDNVQIYLQEQLNRYTEERDEAEKKMRDASIHIIKLRKALNAYNEPSS